MAVSAVRLEVEQVAEEAFLLFLVVATVVVVVAATVVRAVFAAAVVVIVIIVVVTMVTGVCVLIPAGFPFSSRSPPISRPHNNARPRSIRKLTSRLVKSSVMGVSYDGWLRLGCSFSHGHCTLLYSRHSGYILILM